ncbi:V-type ATP synthase subunit I [Maribellus maritimus]|uniref:V-type ATP synthase subunit I n=1 Tax=Maribellus maritimus TaxID=2870838 RepID=UPI001EEC3456|nr:V-type ATPase 116kDa subunit family protein [Maribellus maritimus]MCG6186790.1 V-type ATP synthase subunit I [Maribellus maritimus]
MIVPMYKYYFLVFYKEYNQFLENIQKLGVIHVIEKKVKLTSEIKEKYGTIEQLEKIIDFLEKREIKQLEDLHVESDGINIMNNVFRKQKELEILEQELEEEKKELKKAKPWGDFSHEILGKLKKENLFVRFFIGTKKKYNECLKRGNIVEIISETENQVFFIVLLKDDEKAEYELDEVEPPKIPYPNIKIKCDELEEEIETINRQLDEIAAKDIPSMEKTRMEIMESLCFEKVKLNTAKEADEKLMILEGWIPSTKKQLIDDFLEQNSVHFYFRRATPDDNIPVLLKNNSFSKLFEPIGNMFSLPDYHEMDLTVFFAPFFMLFFGFCLGDAGYGLLFIIGAGIYKLKANKQVKPYLSLIQFLGLATVIFGSVSGTFFGINLIQTEADWLQNIKGLFLDPNKMFNLALVLGAVQIIFGLFIKAANQSKQFGFSYALSTIGWLVVLLGSLIYFLLVNLNAISPNSVILYVVFSAGGFFILFFSDPKANIFSRVGSGIWDVYSTVTGIFGDLLSYIRLFALGLSSAILGFVINDIALQILGSSKILGPVFFAIFLLLGHTLNILISSLGSFVHPMRLTFVEFYKNAGFKGGGEEYKPFSK